MTVQLTDECWLNPHLSGKHPSPEMCIQIGNLKTTSFMKFSNLLFYTGSAHFIGLHKSNEVYRN